MIPKLFLSRREDAARIEELLHDLRLDPVDVALNRGDRAKAVIAVQKILEDVAERGDAALVELSQKFDDPKFSLDQIRVTEKEMREAAGRVPGEQLAAVRRSTRRCGSIRRM